MTEQQTLQAIGEFMLRVRLEGREVQTFNECVKYLNDKIQPKKEEPKKK